MVVLKHAMKAHKGSAGKAAPLIFNTGTRYSQVVSLMPQLIYPQVQSPSYPRERMKGGPQIIQPIIAERLQM